MSSKDVTTFAVADVTPENIKHFHKPKGDVAGALMQFKKNNCIRVIQGTTFPSNVEATANGFVDTVVRAYNQHHNLVLRPDDIWTAIMVQFSFYVNANAEEFRGKFVNFEGKKELVVTEVGTIDSVSYSLLVDKMIEEIHKNLIDDEVKNFVLPNFTTTTKDDYITSGVVLMATMKKYFSYKFSLICGIPNISLDGTVEDWQSIKDRLSKLRSYNLDKWVDMLEPIIQQFINAKSGKVDLEFWSTICHYIGFGSGPRYISGWITAFCVFNSDGVWQGNIEEGKEWPKIDSSDIPSGIVEVDVIVDDNGVQYNTVMFAGHMAMEVLDDTCTLQPSSGWAISLLPEATTSV